MAYSIISNTKVIPLTKKNIDKFQKTLETSSELLVLADYSAKRGQREYLIARIIKSEAGLQIIKSHEKYNKSLTNGKIDKFKKENM